MNEHEYLLVWSVYGVAALGCLLVWCRMTRPLWRWLREPSRVIVAALLFTPTMIDPGRDLMAPAIAVVALDLVFHIGNNLPRARADLIMLASIAMAAYLLFACLRWPLERWLKGRRKDEQADSQEHEPTLRELMQRGLEQAEHTHHGRVEPRL